MIESFKIWEAGLADKDFTDAGRPQIKNKKIINRYKIPNIPTYSFEKDRGIATKAVEGKLPPLGNLASGLRKDSRKDLPIYKYDVVKTAGTKLDSGG